MRFRILFLLFIVNFSGLLAQVQLLSLEGTYQDNDDQLYNSPMVMATSSPEKRDTNQMYGALVGNIQSPPQSAYG